VGLTKMLASLAVRATRVLIVEVPGHWLARVELEQQMSRRGWRRAWAAADADVLAVCGKAGPDLAKIVNRLWEQMPGPRVRIDVRAAKDVSSALVEAATLLLDTQYHRTDARERAQRPQIPEDPGQVSHEDHEGHKDHSSHKDDDQMEHGGHGQMDHDDHEHHESHGQVSHEDHEGHENMTHGHTDPSNHDHGGHDQVSHQHHDQMEHSGHGGHGGHGDHSGMDMAPEGIPLAQGGPDRDGLEMDVLHLPLGPVLPFWPAGLVLHCSLQGDVVVDAVTDVVAGDNHWGGAHGSQPGLSPAVRSDRVMALLALAGASDLAARAGLVRDALVRGDRAAARDSVVRLDRKIRRSWLLRWSLRGVLVLDQSDLQRHDLSESYRGDAYDRLLSMVERIQAEIGSESRVLEQDGVVPWDTVPQLVTGLELGTVRLAVASLNLGPFPTDQEVRHA